MRVERREEEERLSEREASRRLVPVLIGRWVSKVAERPGRTLLATAMLVALALLAASRLGVDTDSSRMLSADLPFRERTEALQEAFPALRNTLVVVVRSESADAADAATAALAASLGGREDAFDWVYAPSADPFLVSHGLLYLGRDALESRLARLGQSADLLAALRVDQSFGNFLRSIGTATALAERAGVDAAALAPLYAETAAVLAAERRGEDRAFDWTGAFGESGGGEGAAGPVLRVVSVGPKLDFTRLQPAAGALAAIRETVDRLDPTLARSVEIGVTGEPALRAEELESVSHGIGLSTAGSLLLVGLLLRLALGTSARAGLALGTLVVTLALTAGFAGLAIGALNLVSIAFVVLMVGLGIDYAIHFVAHFDEHRAEVSSRRVALVRTGRAVGPALALSAATTALAFFAFGATDFVGMAQLGAIGGVGVLIALVVTLTVIPAALTLWPRLDRGPKPAPLARPPRRVRLPLRLLAGAIALAGIALSPFARFEADPMALRDPESPSVRAYEWLEADPRLTPDRLNLLVADAEAAEAATAALRPLPEVGAARWLGDFVPRDQTAKLDLIDLAYPSILHAVEGRPARLGEPGEAVTPEALAERLAARPGRQAAALAAELAAYAARRTPALDAALGAEIFLYFPMMIDRLARQLEAGPVTPESLPAALRERYVTEDGRLRVEVAPADDLEAPGDRAAFVAAVAAVAPGAAGPPDAAAGAAAAVAAAMLQAAALAFAGCALISWASLRDLWRVSATLLPLLMAGAATAGATVLLDLPFNYANVIVLPLLMGIGLDSGVHVALRSGGGAQSVMETSTPRAIIFSALTTMAAFGALALSSHPGTASMGVLLALSVAAAIGMTFAVTPPLARAATRRARKRRSGAEPPWRGDRFGR